MKRVNLHHLPLACLHAGLAFGDALSISRDQYDPAAVHLEGANLASAHLEGAHLEGAHLEGAEAPGAFLQSANLSYVHAAGADLTGANLEGVDLTEADLRACDLSAARLTGVRSLYWARLSGASLAGARLEGANLDSAQLQWATVGDEEVALVRSYASDRSVMNLYRFAFRATLEPVNLRGAHLDSNTNLREAKLGDEAHGSVALADVHFNGANLAVLDWSLLGCLGDERLAREQDAQFKRQQVALFSFGVTSIEAIRAHEAAVRANRQVAIALREQGLNEYADRYAYRARVLERGILRRRLLWRNPHPAVRRRKRIRQASSYLFSLFLDGLAGYGYQPQRSLVAYAVAILSFAMAYFIVGPNNGVPFSPVGALVFSMTSFHGRGFFPGGSPGHSVTLDDLLTVLAAFEAFVGLVIEVSFIATFTQRFFAR